MEKKTKEEGCKSCGNCCWFYAEDTDGWGFCACRADEGDGMDYMNCSDLCEDNFVSRQQMRHYMSVLLLHIRWLDDDMYIHYAPDGDEAVNAMKFAFKYMKIFSEL